MGLDISFYKQSKLDSRYSEELVTFSKVNFILNYFNVDEDLNCDSVYITESQFKQFIADLDDEIYRKFHYGYNEPINEKLKTKAVFFGGSLEYNKCYWNNISYVCSWAHSIIEDIDWNKDNLYMVAWW